MPSSWTGGLSHDPRRNLPARTRLLRMPHAATRPRGHLPKDSRHRGGLALLRGVCARETEMSEVREGGVRMGSSSVDDGNYDEFADACVINGKPRNTGHARWEAALPIAFEIIECFRKQHGFPFRPILGWADQNNMRCEVPDRVVTALKFVNQLCAWGDALDSGGVNAQVYVAAHLEASSSILSRAEV